MLTRCFAGLVVMIMFCPCFALAQSDQSDAAPRSTWTELKPLPSGVTVRSQPSGFEGREYHRCGIRSSANFQKIALLSVQPQAVVFEDFKASVEVNSSTRGLTVALRVVLPNYIDPRTSKPLVTWIRGEKCSKDQKWQRLSVAGSPKQLIQRIRQLRSELKTPDIDFSNAYFNGIGLLLEVHSGPTFVDIRSAKYGPIIRASKNEIANVVQPASSRLQPTNDLPPATRLKIERDRVEVDGRPIFPVIVADHGEPLDFFRQIHGNMVWVSSTQNFDRMQHLLDAGHVVLATPPHPEFDPADFSTPLQGLAPLQHSHPLPSAWILGTGIAADQLPHLLAWAREVRSADKNLHRPLFADMVESEGVASRQIDAIGISQHTASLLKPFGEARNASYLRQNTTAQITLPWEWVQTEIAPGIANWRRESNSSAIVVEPEQILQQFFACLSAGSKGIGFWKSKAFNANNANDQETRAAMQLAGLYLQVLEPQLTNGNLDGHLSVQTTVAATSSLRDTINRPTRDFSYKQSPSGPDAAVIRSGGTAIILAAWWDHQSHYVPQRMSSEIAQMIVSTTETSAAWEMSLTRLNGLRRNPTAGGLQVNLAGFDQHAIVFVTSDVQQRRQLEERIREVAEEAAGLWASLAKLKLARVQQTIQQIDRLIRPPTGISPWLQKAARFNQQAEESLQRRDFSGCERAARQCLQSLRVIQSTYWKQAVQQLTSATCSPHSVSFSSLPDHWLMMQQLQATQPAQRASLLTSGDFENDRALFQGEWKQIEPNPEQFQTSADIVYDSRGSGQSLRIRSWTSERQTSIETDQTALLIASTAMPMMKGDVILVSGRARLGPNLRSTSQNPLVVFDDDLGPEFSVSPSLSTSWKPFQFYRQISRDSDVRLWLGLKDSGEVYLDDLKVVRVSQRGTMGATVKQKNQANTQPVGYQTPEKPSRPQGAASSGPSFP
ncbi:MAG: hypothetical protein ABJZ55_19435 [Fuerstiella sp.]